MLRKLLFPLSIIYGIIISFRNFLFDINFLKSKEFNIPVISVGNITAGGTGKTPHVEYLISILSSKYKIAILSRGYKRKTKGFVLADTSPNSEKIGDEPAQIKNKFPDTIVAVDEKRVNGIKNLLINNLDAIILDDAYQHRYVKPGLSILLIDFNRPISNDFLLPAGNLREHRKAQKRADIIIITKSPNNIKPIDIGLLSKKINPEYYQKIFFTNLIYGKLQSVFSKTIQSPSDFLIGSNIYTIVVFTGIAYTKPFLEYLNNYSKDI
ncbi:MAG: tetraacyldisaccharide 4'-kinase, partial [Bacteroidales bacterium]|nr:tetraacyldisaccharide 4'-kinase [Bacteroidales bacterium]